MKSSGKNEKELEEINEKCESVLRNIEEVRKLSRKRLHLLKEGLKEILEIQEDEDGFKVGDSE